MGLFQSRPAGSSSSNKTTTTESYNCHPCFFLNSFQESFRKATSRGSSDPIGTPLPETPLYQRERRKQVQRAMQQQGTGTATTVFSSKYAGLEKESSEMLLNERCEEEQQQETTIVHDGPDCEQLLLQKYQLLEVLGVGSTSTVRRCVNKQTQEAFAVKIIDVAHIEERFAGMMGQFQTEIEALQNLRHDGIIRLYDVYMTKEKIYIVMELMEGGELFDYVVQKGTLTEEEASKIVRKVTSAIAYMHDKNFIHRDLKPENLLLKQTPRGPYDEIDVKIIDFGLSKAMEEPVASTFLGTRGYLSPEQLSRRDYTKAIDIWALGVIVFVLLCGCLPFDDDSTTISSDELVKIKFQLRYPRWAQNLSPSAKNLLTHLLDVDARTRYTADQALEHPWVKGETAPKHNLLASPARIKKSPALRSPPAMQQQQQGVARGGGRSSGGGSRTQRRNGKRDANVTPPPSQKIVRKTSI